MNTYAYVGGNPLRYIDFAGTNPAAGAIAGAGIGTAILPGPGTVVGAAIGLGVGVWVGDKAIKFFSEPMLATFPPGYLPGDKGAEEWGRRNDIGAKEGRDLFHDIKQGNRKKPGSRAGDNCGVNPDTGDIIDAQGENIGNLNGGR
jgi:hypothetical protein